MRPPARLIRQAGMYEREGKWRNKKVKKRLNRRVSIQERRFVLSTEHCCWFECKTDSKNGQSLSESWKHWEHCLHTAENDGQLLVRGISLLKNITRNVLIESKIHCPLSNKNVTYKTIFLKDYSAYPIQFYPIQLSYIL